MSDQKGNSWTQLLRRSGLLTEGQAATTPAAPPIEPLDRYYSHVTGRDTSEAKAARAKEEQIPKHNGGYDKETGTWSFRSDYKTNRYGEDGLLLRRMRGLDLYKFSECNIDPYTETYQEEFYLDYLSRWPECCWVYEFKGKIVAYILGKIESSPFPPTKEPYDPATNKNTYYLPWHAHITALTVARDFRRINLGTQLSAMLEKVAEHENCWFVDLFVRRDNVNAIKLYKKLGYSVFKVVTEYYNDGMDAYDMRKPLARDKDKKHIRDDGETNRVSPENVW